MRNFGSAVRPNAGSRGFSLIEMLVAVAIVSAVLGIVMNGILRMQQRSKTESTKVDQSQQTRDFIDQMVRDIHNVGYPPPQVINGAPACAGSASIACGVVSYTPTRIWTAAASSTRSRFNCKRVPEESAPAFCSAVSSESPICPARQLTSRK